MRFLDLKKLLPHKKVWKMLTNKLPLKLILMRSKANKKHKNRSCNSKKLTLPSLSMQPKKFKKKPNPHTLIRRNNHHRCFQKRAPVFVDHLFVEPVSVVTEHVIPATKEKSSLLDNLKRSEILDGKSSRAESSNEGTRPESRSEVDDESMVSADDVWESMELASPQMNEINERADEFIARFRAQMNHQEMMARRL